MCFCSQTLVSRVPMLRRPSLHTPIQLSHYRYHPSDTTTSPSRILILHLHSGTRRCLLHLDLALVLYLRCRCELLLVGQCFLLVGALQKLCTLRDLLFGSGLPLRSCCASRCLWK